MALLPYTNRVTTQRTSRERPDRGDRPDRPGSADGPPPRPQGRSRDPERSRDVPTDVLVDVPDAPDAPHADVFVGAGDDEEG